MTTEILEDASYVRRCADGTIDDGMTECRSEAGRLAAYVLRVVPAIEALREARVSTVNRARRTDVAIAALLAAAEAKP